MHRKTSIVLVTLLAVFSLVLAGCNKGVDLTKIKAQAFELLGTYGPQVSGLLGKLGELRARARRRCPTASPARRWPSRRSRARPAPSPG